MVAALLEPAQIPGGQGIVIEDSLVFHLLAYARLKVWITASCSNLHMHLSHTMLKSAYASFSVARNGRNGEVATEPRQRVGLRSATSSQWYGAEELSCFDDAVEVASVASAADSVAGLSASGLSFYGKVPNSAGSARPKAGQSAGMTGTTGSASSERSERGRLRIWPSKCPRGATCS